MNGMVTRIIWGIATLLAGLVFLGLPLKSGTSDFFEQAISSIVGVFLCTVGVLLLRPRETSIDSETDHPEEALIEEGQ